MRNLNQNFSSLKYPIRCDLHLMETFRKLFVSENYAQETRLIFEASKLRNTIPSVYRVKSKVSKAFIQAQVAHGAGA